MIGDEVGPVCLNGCKSRSAGGAPVRARTPHLLCVRCFTRVQDWLSDLPRLWTLLDAYVARGSVEPPADEAGVSKNWTPPMPIRPEVVALRDRRGDLSVRGRLRVWADQLVADKRLEHADLETELGVMALLKRHEGWLVSQPAAKEASLDLRELVRDLKHAVGEQGKPKVGICQEPSDEDPELPCGGPLLAEQTSTGVYCPRCGDRWGEDDLRGLGILLAQSGAALTSLTRRQA